MLKQKYQFKNYNWVLIGAVLILSGMGVFFINSADSSYTEQAASWTYILYRSNVVFVCCKF